MILAEYFRGRRLQVGAWLPAAGDNGLSSPSCLGCCWRRWARWAFNVHISSTPLIMDLSGMLPSLPSSARQAWLGGLAQMTSLVGGLRGSNNIECIVYLARGSGPYLDKFEEVIRVCPLGRIWWDMGAQEAGG